jgi:hypothetical protein
MDMVYGFFLSSALTCIHVYSRAGSRTDMYTKLRLVAVCFAVAIGTGLIGQLWVVSLDILSLSEAARGVLFLLVALGLMGYQRLSLGLSAIICLPSVLAHPLTLSGNVLVTGQYALLALSIVLLVMHTQKPTDDK